MRDMQGDPRHRVLQHGHLHSCAETAAVKSLQAGAKGGGRMGGGEERKSLTFLAGSLRLQALHQVVLWDIVSGI